MLRITRKVSSPEVITLILEGRIADEWVAVLAEECSKTMLENKELVLDCVGVSFVDAHGSETLRRLVGERVRLIGASPLLASLLDVNSGER